MRDVGVAKHDDGSPSLHYASGFRPHVNVGFGTIPRPPGAAQTPSFNVYGLERMVR